MINCKVEFLEETDGKEILCAEIKYGQSYWVDDKKKEVLLPVGFSKNELSLFLAALDFEYDNGYDGQELYGTIWYKDGTWSDRGEYDGSEWWVYQSFPSIPDALRMVPNNK